MEAKIRDVVTRYGLASGVSVVAVSGGVDSVVLLRILCKYLGRNNLIVAHLNHGLRRASSAEAKFVKNLAEKYGLIYKEKTLRNAKRDEASLRLERYKWLQSVANDNGARYIITAHHLDDQLETIILNLIRGTGPLEIWGMNECEGNLLRPLLDFPKSEIAKYAKNNGLEFCEDKSNYDVSYARNRVRQKVVPNLLAVNPALYRVIKREVGLGREAKAALRSILDKYAEKYVRGNTIDLRFFESAPIYFQREMILKMLKEAIGREGDIYQKNVAEILNLLTKKGSKKTQLGHLTVVKNYKSLVFGPEGPKIDAPRRLRLGSNRFNGRVITLSRGTARANKRRLLLPDSFSDNLVVRTWRPGDKIKSNCGTKKVQDIFVDAKVDREERKRWPIITHKEEIIWIPLLQAAEIKNRNKNLILEVK